MLGISRRIDQLGRVVIPIEVRKRLKLDEGSLLDIVVENESIILSKSEPLKDFKNYIVDVCESVEDCVFLVISDSSLIFASKQFKDFEGEKVNLDFIEQIKASKGEKGDYLVVNGLEVKDKFGYFFPLASFGDTHGYACFFFQEVAKSEERGMMCFVSKYIASKL